MRETDEETGSSVGAPLLQSERNYGSGFSSPLFVREDGDGCAGEESAVESARPQHLGTWFVWALTLSAGISGLLFGYEYVQSLFFFFVNVLLWECSTCMYISCADCDVISTAVISSTLVTIRSDLSRELTTLDKSLITSCTSLFALIASPLAGACSDKLGRKPVIIIADCLFVLGALWQSAASAVWEMIVGRSLVGLAVGAASLVTPM